MKIKPTMAVITDSHLKPENINLILDIFSQFIDLINSLGLKSAVHSGDFFTSRSSQSLLCLLTATKIFDKFEENKITLHIIPGNHDKVDLTDEESYLTIFNNRDYVKLHDAEDFIEMDGVIFGFLPYFKEGEEYLTRLLNLNNLVGSFNLRVLFTHTSINGVMNNDGSVVEGDIESSFFDFYDLVMVGHYHNRSQVGENIYYIGSSHQSNYGEDEEKGFTVINNDLSFYHVQSNFPTYKKFKIDVSDKKLAQKLLKDNSNTGNNIRFIFEGSQEEIDNMDVSVYAGAGISVEKQNIEEKVRFESIDECEVLNYDKKTIMKNFIKYAQSVGYQPEQRKKGMEFLSNLKFN